MYIHKDISRRSFLRRSAQLGSLGVAAPLAGSLGLLGEAAAATAPDYKALVCVFLYGGNDYANTVPPFDPDNYSRYAAARPGLALSRPALETMVLSPVNDLGGHQYALNPALSPLKTLFDQGHLGVLLNVGTLIQPTTKRQFETNSVPLPPKLFSHNDQQSFFQASGAEGASSGWGGRMGDLMQSGNKTTALTCVSVNGNSVFLAGKHTRQYSVAPSGIEQFLDGRSDLAGSAELAKSLRQIMQRSGGRLLADEYAEIASRALPLSSEVAQALAGAPYANFNLLPKGEFLANQLLMVARMIAVSGTLGIKRQVFFVSLGGWDLHDGMPNKHPALLGKLGRALKGFFDTTVALGVSDKVTTFTASDFGRSLVGNDDGTDHGWGGMHFVMGGAVRGQRIYGTPPVIGANTNDDVDSGRLIPTTSVDQYAATLASWFGVGKGDLKSIMPNLANFNSSSWNLGFV